VFRGQKGIKKIIKRDATENIVSPFIHSIVKANCGKLNKNMPRVGKFVKDFLYRI
jgi:hypothetical protein